MNIQILFEADEALSYARERLGEMKKKAPLAVRTALNQTAKLAKKQDENVTKKTYTAKGDINSLKLSSATTSNLQAILKDSGSSIPMSHFTHYAGKRGVSAIINKNHGRKQIGKYGNKAFFWNTIFVRSGAERLPIEKLMSISSPVMHGNENTWGSIDSNVRKILYNNIEKQVERILG